MRLWRDRLMESVQLLGLIIEKMERAGDGVGVVREERGGLRRWMALYQHSE